MQPHPNDYAMLYEMLKQMHKGHNHKRSRIRSSMHVIFLWGGPPPALLYLYGMGSSPRLVQGVTCNFGKAMYNGWLPGRTRQPLRLTSRTYGDAQYSMSFA